MLPVCVLWNDFISYMYVLVKNNKNCVTYDVRYHLHRYVCPNVKDKCSNANFIWQAHYIGHDHFHQLLSLFFFFFFCFFFFLINFRKENHIFGRR